MEVTGQISTISSTRCRDKRFFRRPEARRRLRRSIRDSLRLSATHSLRIAEGHHRQLHSTNPLERLNEITRRMRVVEIFPDDAAIARPVGAMMMEQNDEWAIARRDTTLTTLEGERVRRSERRHRGPRGAELIDWPAAPTESRRRVETT